MDDDLQDFLDKYFQEILEDMSDIAHEEFKKGTNNNYVDLSKNRICHICKHFSLLTDRCNKSNEIKNKKDTCKEWEE